MAGTDNGIAGARWRPQPSSQAQRAIGGVVILFGSAVSAFVVAAIQEPGPVALALLVLAALLLFAGLACLPWVFGVLQLGYKLGPRELEISWMGKVVRVPYHSIEGIYSGRRLAGMRMPRSGGPGMVIGRGGASGLGPVECFCSTSDSREWLFITLGDRGIVLSPARTTEFRAALIERVELAEATAIGSVSITKGREFPWSTFKDRWAWATWGLALLALLVSTTVLELRFSALPESLPLRFDAQGQVREIGARGVLFRLPLVGLLLLAANAILGALVHAREPFLGRFLWIGAAVVAWSLAAATWRLAA